MTSITEHLARLDARIAAATRSAGRSPGSVTVVAVSKGHPAASVTAAREAGLRHFGENYLQEALPKIQAADSDAVWHFIGGIQSNKTRPIAEHFDWVQSLDDRRIAERLAAQRPFHGEPLAVLIQLKPRSAPGRGGCPEEDLVALAACIAGLPRLSLRGLMVVPAAGLDPPALAGEYAWARDWFVQLRQHGHAGLDTLSMGMSDDLEIAIAAGSTMVRVGTALFGPRPRPAGGRSSPAAG